VRRAVNIFSVVLIACISMTLVACATATTPRSIGLEQRVIDPSHPPALLELNFKSHGERLNGILYQANGAGPHPTVVLLHGYPGNEKNLDLAQSLRRAGFNVLFFHYRGAWGSSGDFSFTHVIEDVASALSYLRSSPSELRVDKSQLLLIGHSMGGFAALQGAARDTDINCVAGLTPADVGLLARAAAADDTITQDFATGADDLPMLRGWNGKAALADMKVNADRFDVAALAPQLAGKSVLLVAADKDTVIAPDIFHVPMVAAYKAQGDIDLTHTILSGDHSFSWSRLELIDTVLDWAQTCEGNR